MSEAVSKLEKNNASILRRLAAAFYDGLLLLGVLMIASALTVPFTQNGLIKPENILIKIYMLLVCYLFFVWFWVRGGQTLGMRVWHLRIEQLNGELISWQQGSLRFAIGLPAWTLLLLGFIRAYVPEAHQSTHFPAWLMSINPWILLSMGAGLFFIDHLKNSFRDKLSGTHIIFKK